MGVCRVGTETDCCGARSDTLVIEVLGNKPLLVCIHADHEVYCKICLLRMFHSITHGEGTPT